MGSFIFYPLIVFYDELDLLLVQSERLSIISLPPFQNGTDDIISFINGAFWVYIVNYNYELPFLHEFASCRIADTKLYFGFYQRSLIRTFQRNNFLKKFTFSNTVLQMENTVIPTFISRLSVGLLMPKVKNLFSAVK